MNPDEFRGKDHNNLFKSHHLDLYEEILSYSSFQSFENQLSIQNLKDTITQDKILNESSDFLTKIDINSEEQIIQFLIKYSKIFSRKNRKINYSILSKEKNALIDQVIEKLIFILTKCDVMMQRILFLCTISSLKKMIKVYRFFDKNNSIELLNSYIIHLFQECSIQEVQYFLLFFIKSYYMYFNEQFSRIFNENILPKMIENDELLFQFLPTKENEIYQKNPLISIFMIFVHHEIKKNPGFSEKIQVIFDFLSRYISECQDLMIKSNQDDDCIDGNYTTKIENHISYSIQVYIVAISHLGANFFDLYNHHKFPRDFLCFYEYSNDAKRSSINFIHKCCQKKIDITDFLDEDICSSLIRLSINNEFKIKVIDIIDSLIKINNSIIDDFINAEIEQSIICKDNLINEQFDNVLNYMKLIQTIIHFYPPNFYRFDIQEFVKCCIKYLIDEYNDLSIIIYQIFIDMYNHLLKLGEPQLSLFNSQFLASGGIELTQEYIDEPDDDETSNYANLFLTLFKSNMESKEPDSVT